MPLQVTSDNLEVTPNMKVLVERKVSKILNKLSDLPKDLVNLRVVLNKGSEEDTFEAKIELSAGGKMIVGEGFEYNKQSALVRAVDDTLRRYKKEKSKKESVEWKKQRDLKKYHDRQDDQTP